MQSTSMKTEKINWLSHRWVDPGVGVWSRDSGRSLTNLISSSFSGPTERHFPFSLEVRWGTCHFDSGHRM